MPRAEEPAEAWSGPGRGESAVTPSTVAAAGRTGCKTAVMPDIEETPLPGVGLRHEFTTADGERVGVVTHRRGQRDLIVYDREDPDAAARAVRLDDDDSHVLAELLGGTRVSQNLSRMIQDVEGITLEWLAVGHAWWCAGRSIADSMLRRKTGVSIIAILRDDATIASPGPETRLLGGDTVVIVGTQDGLRRAAAHLQGGTA